MIQIFTLALDANEAREVAIAGEYFELRNAVYPVALIELLDRSGGVISRLENPEQSDFVKPGRYETIRITNGPTAQVIKHFYGSGEAGSRRTSGQVQVIGTVAVTGDVSVIDGEKSRSLGGMLYVGAPYRGAVAAQYPFAQIWNPVGSGKNIIVQKGRFSSDIAGAVGITFSTVAKSTDVTATRAKNKKAGAAIGAAQVRTENSAAFPASVMWQCLAQANAPQEWKPEGPIIVPEGYGMDVFADQLNSSILADFEWYEEAA